MTVQEIYNVIDAIAPFSTQEKWDNSGLLVGWGYEEVTGIVVALDITKSVIGYAESHGCNLIVSHHPVIFEPLRSLHSRSIPYLLAEYQMNAICCHTPLDLAAGGLNDLLCERLEKVLPVADIEPFMDDGLGRILTLDHAHDFVWVAQQAKDVLKSPLVRYSYPYDDVRRIAVCTGSGASLLEDCVGRADCLLTGDVKHDRWHKAVELDLGLIDCGHFETEVIMVPYLIRILSDAFPELPVEGIVTPPYGCV